MVQLSRQSFVLAIVMDNLSAIGDIIPRRQRELILVLIISHVSIRPYLFLYLTVYVQGRQVGMVYLRRLPT